MPAAAINIGALLLLILPGFLAYRFAVWSRADPTQRSALWQVSEMLEHSVYVHIIGIALLFGAHRIALKFGGTDLVQEFLKNGYAQFFKENFYEATAWFVFYALYIIIFSAIVGAYGLPDKVSSFIVKAMAYLSWRLSKFRALSWIPKPERAFPQEPVWYYAFDTLAKTDGRTTKVPHVIVAMKRGDIYVGRIHSYPIVPDTQTEKDFLITKARFYKNGDPHAEQRLDSLDGVGAVLLNTANVDSIKLYYATIPSQEAN